ncbi:DNA polymerase-1 [Microbacterium halimionae]|uniref:DNA-directed DNA polymerase n=1 Tax=Microbacterium halimionae TaxID=1526413 RepID=A0A7W3JNE0_9MICO|nr:bifunctional 3'-5' exonuclease/DNA polymerase [Microbacterium halimionae]MBA8816051.1 DNA polymerase-1 [Microbacterium halimionae]NII96253.1 DNA polymerase-1 [Microbacterium halimionae]
MATAEQSPWVILARNNDGAVVALSTNTDAARTGTEIVTDLSAYVAEPSRARTRWVWNDTRNWYPELLGAGVRVDRCQDLRLSHAILRQSTLVDDDHGIRAQAAWENDPAQQIPRGQALFALEHDDVSALPSNPDEVFAEFARQHAAVAGSRDSQRLRLLIAAESAGALVAAELHEAGVPWDANAHRDLLHDVLGARGAGGIPQKLAQAADVVREVLDAPDLRVDSPAHLLKALHRAGVMVPSTSRWVLGDVEHPSIAPILRYKKLSRLHTANGEAWLSEWVHDGRYRPTYLPGGVVTGRWAATGGGALQIPRSLRGAVRADPGWTFIVADVAQLEPRALAAIAGDNKLAEAARGRDLYSGIVESGTLPTRADAKAAMLGAMYGATTGDSGRLVPTLRKAYPKAMKYVDHAALEGERGGVVSTWLGRSCEVPSGRWREEQAEASDPAASTAAQSAARGRARERGRFTRNFVVQGTAAEWALCWMAQLRTKLAAFSPIPDTAQRAESSGPTMSRRPHLAFFLHDEIIVHTPVDQAEAAADAVRSAAAEATSILFGSFPIDFPLDLRIAMSAAKE